MHVVLFLLIPFTICLLALVVLGWTYPTRNVRFDGIFVSHGAWLDDIVTALYGKQEVDICTEILFEYARLKQLLS